MEKEKSVAAPKNPKPKSFEVKLPDAYVLIFYFIILATILTYIIPAGKFDVVPGKTVIDAKSFHYIPQTPLGLMDFLLAVPEGFRVGSPIILVLFIIGGVFRIVRETNALELSVQATANKFGDKVLLIIPLLLGLTGFLGTAGVFISSCIAFMPLGIVIAKQLRLDPVFAVVIIFIGSHVAFMASPICPVTTVIAQQIAGLPIYSGMAYRTLCTVILLALAIIYVMWYAHRVRSDRNNSVMGGDFKFEDAEEAIQGNETFTFRHLIIVIMFFSAFLLFAYGSKELKWGLNHLGAVLLPVGIISGLLNGKNADQIAASFVKGAQAMVYGGLVIGLASGISVVLEKGNVMHSIIYNLAQPLSHVAPTFSALGMFLVTSVADFFIPSGSGKAVIMMPILAPLADLIGISRQVSVLAYQMGDGISNITIPTYGILMGCLAIARVSFQDWLKWVVPLVGILGAAMIILLVIAVQINFT